MEGNFKKLNKERSHHGGDVYSEGRSSLMDLSSNINPYPFPEKLISSLPEILEKARRYPDIEYRSLKKTISEYLTYLTGIEDSYEEFLTLGDGAVEILDKSISIFDSIIILRPSFSEYSVSAARYNKEIIFADRDMEMERGVLGEKTAECILKAWKGRKNSLIALCSPNNPDGAVWDTEVLRMVLNEIKSSGSFVLMDETFGEFTGKKKTSVLASLPEMTNIITVKALTKFFGLPGVRLGYGVCRDKNITEKIIRRQTTWNIGTFAESIAGILMKDKEFIEESITLNIKNRMYLYEILEKSNLFSDIFPSHSDFISAELKKEIISEDFSEFLMDSGFLVRNLKDMPPLTERHFRFAVKVKEVSDKLKDALRKADHKFLK